RRVADDLFGRHVARGRLAVDVHRLAALLDEHHAHAPADILARRLQHLVAAARIELDPDGRTLLRGLSARVGELIAGDDDVAPQQDGLLRAAHVVQLRAERRAAALRGLDRAVLRVLEAPFERRDLAENVLHFGRVLHARELHIDAVETLALHDG